MNRKQKKERKRLQSTRQLMGIDQFTSDGLKAGRRELVYFLIRPDNLSVLPPEGIRARVMALTNLLRGVDAVCMMALDSRESFQGNKDWYRRRMEQEDLPALRELLRQDAAHLDSIQADTASAREFALVFTLDRQKEESARTQVSRLEKSLETWVSASAGPGSRTSCACWPSIIRATLQRRSSTTSTARGGWK